MEEIIISTTLAYIVNESIFKKKYLGSFKNRMKKKTIV